MLSKTSQTGQSMTAHSRERRDQPAHSPSDDTAPPAVWADLQEEYHTLVDLDRRQGLTPEQHSRLQAVEGKLDELDEASPEAQWMWERMAEMEEKLDTLRQDVRALAARSGPA